MLATWGFGKRSFPAVSTGMLGLGLLARGIGDANTSRLLGVDRVTDRVKSYLHLYKEQAEGAPRPIGQEYTH
jgi:hypothetical protein